MNVIKDFSRKKELEQKLRIKLKEVVNWNTSWAKDKDGNKDNINLIHCLVFDAGGLGDVVYFPTEKESENIYKNYREVAQFNRENDNTGKKYNKKQHIKNLDNLIHNIKELDCDVYVDEDEDVPRIVWKNREV